MTLKNRLIKFKFLKRRLKPIFIFKNLKSRRGTTRKVESVCTLEGRIFRVFLLKQWLNTVNSKAHATFDRIKRKTKRKI